MRRLIAVAPECRNATINHYQAGNNQHQAHQMMPLQILTKNQNAEQDSGRWHKHCYQRQIGSAGRCQDPEIQDIGKGR